MSDLRAVEDAMLYQAYPKKPASITRAENAWLWAEDGTRYLDLGANYGVANVGHAHPHVVQAIRDQAGRLIHIPLTLYSAERGRFLERLRGILPHRLQRVFPQNSGTEANEAALKFARAATRRTGFVAARNAFHGRTFGSLSLTWKKEYRAPFEPLVGDTSFVPYNDVAALEAAVTDRTAALVLEPVQGEGGVVPATLEYLRAARRICDEHGSLLILDEIQTGLGRTGHMWGFQHFGVEPDLFTIGKSLAGGLPMAAVAMREEVANAMPKGAHGSTFAGAPLVCAAAEATLDVLVRERLPERAATEGARALAQLRALQVPLVRDVRGLGLMIGIDLRIKPAPVLQALFERRVLALQAGTTVLRLLPPLTIPSADLDAGLATVAEVLRNTPMTTEPAVAT